MNCFSLNFNLLVVFLLCFFLQSCGDPCSHEEIQRKTSPDGKYDAVVIEDNCGATTDYGYGIYVLPKGKKANPRLELFELSTNQVNVGGICAAALNPDGEPGLDVRWLSPRKLTIEYYECKRGTIQPLVKFDAQQFETVARAGVTVSNRNFIHGGFMRP